MEFAKQKTLLVFRVYVHSGDNDDVDVLHDEKGKISPMDEDPSTENNKREDDLACSCYKALSISMSTLSDKTGHKRMTT